MPSVPECWGHDLVSSWVIELRVTPSPLEWDVSSTLLSYAVSWSCVPQPPKVAMCVLVLEPTDLTKSPSIWSLVNLDPMQGAERAERVYGVAWGKVVTI